MSLGSVLQHCAISSAGYGVEVHLLRLCFGLLVTGAMLFWKILNSKNDLHKQAASFFDILNMAKHRHGIKATNKVFAMAKGSF